MSEDKDKQADEKARNIVVAILLLAAAFWCVIKPIYDFVMQPCSDNFFTGILGIIGFCYAFNWITDDLK